jgi:hypothetical protein
MPPGSAACEVKVTSGEANLVRFQSSSTAFAARGARAAHFQELDEHPGIVDVVLASVAGAPTAGRRCTSSDRAGCERRLQDAAPAA